MNDIAVIHTRRGQFCIVDAWLAKDLRRYTWSVNAGYFSGRIGGRGSPMVYLHQIVNDTPRGLETDHRNRCRIDNTARNLRCSRRHSNTINSAKFGMRSPVNFSRFKGVNRVVRYGVPENKWRARLVREDLGTFDSEEDAALAYNEAAKAKYGEFAYLNEV